MKATNTPLKYNSNLALLHAIRGVAALYVVVFHARFIFWPGGHEYLERFPRATWNIVNYFFFSVGMLFTAGAQMVMIFFVLSGFFIAMSFESLKGSLQNKLKVFYSVRFTRIYIPFIASAILGVCVLYSITKIAPGLAHADPDRTFNKSLAEAQQDETILNFIRSLFFFKDKQYIGHNFAYWSLLHEGIFYLIVPFVFQYKKAYHIVSTLFFIAGIFMIGIHGDRNKNAWLLFFFEYNFYFAIGHAIYMYRDKLAQYAKHSYFKIFAVVASVLLFCCFDILTLLKQIFLSNFLAAITGALLIILFLNYDLKNNFIVRSVKKLGQMSYSLYLIHVPVLILVYAFFYRYTGATKSYGQVYLIGVLFAVIIGWLFYQTIEKPSLSVIKRIKRAMT